ncbi:hypothetical protein GPECTOR_647g762 [Gonium pectorale]|uniref:Uncharacterized protein n=1 Tax=Gonium pectorale TaxID=33097 RepID=A0A150FW05_GONPE|nr:hypothetical protein GPECTOR_647g762 [Gonium pectorale]|eukprot:KXZ41210.1 hypothetical protein GPECTOR_647g762 [Gonium pectorale]
MDREFTTMQRQMDRDIDMALSRARELERQADAEFRRSMTDSDARLRTSLREDLRSAPNVDIQRQEERGPGTYRYYERIQITSGGGGGRVVAVPPTAATTLAAPPPAAGVSPALVGALIAVGSYVAVTAAFNRNYHLTSYTEQKRWLLLALWPLLVLFSPKFREHIERFLDIFSG